MNQFVYLLKGEDLTHFLNENTRKSIPYSFLEEFGYKIQEKYNPSLDYLKIVDEIYFKGETL